MTSLRVGGTGGVFCSLFDITGPVLTVSSHLFRQDVCTGLLHRPQRVGKRLMYMRERQSA